LLLRHPEVEIAYATSRSQEDVRVADVHRNLEGITNLRFSTPSDEELMEYADIIIGALPHGASAEVLEPFVRAGKRVVDLSGDYRLKSVDDYSEWYGREHPCPDLLERAVYGCPEVNADAIAGAQLVASPGCFATSMNLALLPLAQEKLIAGRATVVGMTASSGSGANAKAGTHHPIRSQTLRPYKVLKHQHTPEVSQFVRSVGGEIEAIDFTPVSAPIVRGILTIVTVPVVEEMSSGEVAELFAQTYKNAPFAKVISQREPECATIAGTNYFEVRARVTDDGRVHVVCASDNLVKGGAGQAVQCLNLMLGVDETTGLDWPGSWP
jgi:N-acetyl-gamma-glutamyl-phosphate reductase